MNRREALNRVALLMGGAVSTPTIIAIMQGCSDSGSAGTPFSLSADYQTLLTGLAEVIIPETDTPGAKEVGVGPFIELMIKDCYSDAQGVHFSKGLAMVEEKAKALGGNFITLSASDKTAVLKAMEAAAKEEKVAASAPKEIDSETGKEKEKDVSKDPVTPFFTLLKELTIFGYFTSEIGATQERDFVPIPGRYDPCIPLEEGQKAYTLS